MRTVVATLVAALLLTACERYPRDPSGTASRVGVTRQLKVAIVPGTPATTPATAVLYATARRFGGRVSYRFGHGEPLLVDLERGRLDAVIGHFAKESPWAERLSFSEPIVGDEPSDDQRPVLRIARRNGENRFILAMDRIIAR